MLAVPWTAERLGMTVVQNLSEALTQRWGGEHLPAWSCWGPCSPHVCRSGRPSQPSTSEEGLQLSQPFFSGVEGEENIAVQSTSLSQTKTEKRYEDTTEEERIWQGPRCTKMLCSLLPPCFEGLAGCSQGQLWHWADVLAMNLLHPDPPALFPSLTLDLLIHYRPVSEGMAPAHSSYQASSSLAEQLSLWCSRSCYQRERTRSTDSNAV